MLLSTLRVREAGHQTVWVTEAEHQILAVEVFWRLEVVHRTVRRLEAVEWTVMLQLKRQRPQTWV